MTSKVTAVAKAKKSHPPAATKAKEAQEAALAPSDDLSGQAKAAKADTMDAQQAGTFDKKAFIAAVKAAIEAKSPKTLKEADTYKSSGKAGEVKDEVKGLVTQGKEEQGKDIESATKAPPDQSKAVPKPVSPMGPEDPGPSAAVGAAGAVPKPAPPEQVNLEGGKQEVNQEMADGDVDAGQIEESHEPEFEQALADKRKAEEHADAAPGAYRQVEQQVIAQGKAEAEGTTTAGVADLHGAKAGALAKLVGDKTKTKTKDEARRSEVTTKVQGIFDTTEAAVRTILDGIDPKVEAAFEKGEKVARSVFESYVGAKMSAYKKDRYGGWLGGLRWAKDKLLGMPSKVDEFYVAGRELYLKEMDRVISRVADIVGGDLTAAKKRIAKGRADIAAYVKNLPADLKKVGAEATREMADRFDKLEEDVNAKQEAVVDTLATKYTEARKGLDDRIEELQAENKGLVDKAIGAIKAVIETIRKLAAMLRDVLARVAGVVGGIVKAPVKFLGNLIDGVKGGILRFKDNIVEHLRKGLMTWLFGALAESGVELPDTFDLKGIVKLLASIFGLTWRSIRNRLVKQIGEPAMGAVEKGVDIFTKIAAGGLGAVWEMLVEKLGDIKEMILEQVKDFVITKVITAGITWLIGLLNPAAAFIKACKLIYDVIMFFVNNAERILKFVNTVVDSAADILRGNISGVVSKIENVLGQMVPILIGFLASVIGLGGIGEKVRKIVEALQKPFTKALDFVIKTGLKLAGPVIRGLKGIAGKVKGKIVAGKAWVKGKAEAGKQWAKSKISRLRERAGFSAKGKQHSVTLVGDSPDAIRIMVASTPRELGRAMTTAMEASDLDRMPGARSRVAAARGDVAARERALRALARESMMRSGTKVPPNLVPAVQALADAIARCWEEIGYNGERVERVERQGHAGQAGDVHRHGRKGSEYDPAKSGRAKAVSRLESEHVVPWGWIQEIVSAFRLGQLPAQDRGSDEAGAPVAASVAYPRLTTVMTYERAAEFKTSQLQNNDREFLTWIRGVGPREAQATLKDHLPRLVRSRMEIITTATGLYVARVLREDNITLPTRPDQATIRRATAGQLAEIFAALREARR